MMSCMNSLIWNPLISRPTWLAVRLVVVFGLLIAFNACIRLSQVSIAPSSRAKVGDSVRLDCLYELNGDSLYSLKWSKGHNEFYRMHGSKKPPKGVPSLQFFPLEGILVDERRSKNGSVVLRNVTHSSSGEYECEISAEPTFQTIASKVSLSVLEPGELANKSPLGWRVRPAVTIGQVVLYLITCYLCLPVRFTW